MSIVMKYPVRIYVQAIYKYKHLNINMADTCIHYLSLLAVSTGFVSSEACSGCFIGNGWRSSPCSDCCCTRDIPKSENCCYKIAHDKAPTNEGPIEGTFIYFVAALFSLIFVTVIILCCFRVSEIKCLKWLRRKSNARNRNLSTTERSTNCNLDGNDNPPAYESIEMQELQIVVPKSPPYIKDPPPYTEALANPTDISEYNYNEIEQT